MKAIKRYLQNLVITGIEWWGREDATNVDNHPAVQRRLAELDRVVFVIFYYADENAPSQFQALTTNPQAWKKGNWQAVHNYGYGGLRYLLEDDDSAYYEALEWTLE